MSELAKLAKLADQQLAAEQVVFEREKELKQAQRELKELSEVQIPELMDELGIDGFETTSGLKITIKENIRASISKANLSKALQWLKDNGHGKMIQRTFSVVPSDDDEAATLTQLLDKYEYSDLPKVHHQTLTSFVRNKLEAGEEIPMELLGVYRQRVSKIQK